MSGICDFLGLTTVARECKQILFHEFGQLRNVPIYCSHFFPCSRFEGDEGSDGGWFADYKVKDLSNGDLYPRDTLIRLKCLALATLGIIAQTLFALCNLINRIVKLVCFAHFWHSSREEFSLVDNVCLFGKDLLRVVFAPVIFVMIELAALYGIVAPLNGRKLYATLERGFYEDGRLAPCFQPREQGVPLRHFFGGDPNNPDAW